MSGNYNPPEIDKETFGELQMFLKGYGLTHYEAIVIYETKATRTPYTDIKTLQKKIQISDTGQSLEKTIKDLAHPSRGFLHLYYKKDELCFHCIGLGNMVYSEIKEEGLADYLEYYEYYESLFLDEKIPYNPNKLKIGDKITSKCKGEKIIINIVDLYVTDNKIISDEGTISYETKVDIIIEGCPGCNSWIHASFLINQDNIWIEPFYVKCKNCSTVLEIYRSLWNFKIV